MDDEDGEPRVVLPSLKLSLTAFSFRMASLVVLPDKQRQLLLQAPNGYLRLRYCDTQAKFVIY